MKNYINGKKDEIDNGSVIIGILLGIIIFSGVIFAFLSFSNVSINTPPGEKIQLSLDHTPISLFSEREVITIHNYSDVISAETFVALEDSYTFSTSENTSVIIGFANSISREYFTQLQNAIYKIPFVTTEQIMGFKIALESDPNIVYVKFDSPTESILKKAFNMKQEIEYISKSESINVIRYEAELNKLRFDVSRAMLEKEILDIN